MNIPKPHRSNLIVAALLIIFTISVGIVVAAFNASISIPITVRSPPASAVINSAFLSNNTSTLQCVVSGASASCPDPNLFVGQSMNLTMQLTGTPNAPVIYASQVPLYVKFTVLANPISLDLSGKGTWLFNIQAVSAGSSGVISVSLQTPAGQP